MIKWDFDGGPHDDAWTWSCLDTDTGRVIRQSTQVFATLRECVLDAVKQSVADVRSHSESRKSLEHALVWRKFLTALLSRAEARGDDGQVADIEYRLSEVDGTIALLTHTTTRH